MKQIILEEATVQQIKEFALAVCKIEIPATANKETAIARLRAGWTMDYILGDPEELEPETDSPAADGEQAPESLLTPAPAAPTPPPEAYLAREVPANHPDALRPPAETLYQAPPSLAQPPAPVAPRGSKADTRAPITEPRIELEIMTSELAGGTEPIPLGCNGTVMWVPRGKRVVIPIRYLASLENAKIKTYHQDPDDITMEIVELEGQIYPFRITSAPFLLPEGQAVIDRQNAELMAPAPA